MTEATFGLCCKDCVILAADCHAAQSIARLKDDVDKITEIQKMGFAAVGPNADTVNFLEYISKNMRLYQLRTGLDLNVKAAVNFTRNELATALRKGPYQVDLLVGGYDADGPSLYFLDYLASSEKVNKGAHGYGAYFTLSIMDRYYKPDLTLEEGIEIIRKCIKEMQTRFITVMSTFKVKVVDKDGMREITI